jgi:hypothetical protein
LFLKRPEESLLSEGDLKKQKNQAKRGGCFLFSGLKLRDQRSYSRQLHDQASTATSARKWFLF